ncbi:TIGR04255 family protein [Acetobacter malorum]|uniref:TIGR04255 family protein n=1 Tax=Acetobacter malorum TaxID=178901 RepID=A0A1Y3G7X3_9PROT|nr:TIGR04255 family protein [Acetobacter malorum]OUJ05370.1 hypothetical protein HK23_06270 [Acetobacter malorum]
MSELLKFEHPPVTETIIGLQFNPVGFMNYHSGLLWEKFKEYYTGIQEQAVVQPVFEMFGGNSPNLNQMNFPFPFPFPPFGNTEASRYWFISADDTEVMQIQNNRILHNWRKRSEDQKYPHYNNIKEKFFNDLHVTREFFCQRSIGEIIPNQCELCYVNIIKLNDDRYSIKNAHDLTHLLAQKVTPPSSNLKFEGSGISSRFVLYDTNQEPCGRVHLNLAPENFNGGMVTALKLEVMVRARPSKDSFPDALPAFYDTLHDTALKVFMSVIADEVLAAWGVQK